MSDQIKCLNCGQTVSGNFCRHCSQRTNTRRITMNSLLENLVVGISNINRGFFYNVKMLTIRPGSTMIGYLDGKRVKLFHPVQYAIICVTLLTLVDARFGSSTANIDIPGGVRDTATYSFGYRYGKFLAHNIKYMWLLTIPAFSLPASWFFGKLNFAEHLTVQSFICGHTALMTAALYLLYRGSFIFSPITYILLWILMALTYRRLYPTWQVILQIPLVIFIGILLFVLLPATVLWLFQ